MVDRINSVGVQGWNPQPPKVSRGFGGGFLEAEIIFRDFFPKKRIFKHTLV